VAAAAGACGKPEGECFEGAGVVTGGFKPFGVDSPFVALRSAFLVERLAGNAGALSEQFSDADLVANHFSDSNSSFAIAEIQFQAFGMFI